MKTNELTGAALDWAVAICEGYKPQDWDDDRLCFLTASWGEDFEPSINWAQSGAIIERERIQLSPGLAHDDHSWSAVRYDHLFDDDLDCFMGGATPLIAAMRCYVASKLGDDVDVPQELN